MKQSNKIFIALIMSVYSSGLVLGTSSSNLDTKFEGGGPPEFLQGNNGPHDEGTSTAIEAFCRTLEELDGPHDSPVSLNPNTLKTLEDIQAARNEVNAELAKLRKQLGLHGDGQNRIDALLHDKSAAFAAALGCGQTGEYNPLLTPGSRPSRNSGGENTRLVRRGSSTKIDRGMGKR